MKVLLMMSDTGGGHRASAQAIAAALKQVSPDVETEVVDAIQEVSPFWRAVVGLYGPIIRAAPWLWGMLFKVFGGGGGAWLWGITARVVAWTVRGRLVPYVDRKHPDVLCSTHPLINQIAQTGRERYARERGRRLPLVVVVTDPVTFHPSWIEPRADLTVVATVEARDAAVRYGADPAKVRVLGLPIRPDFAGAEGVARDENAERREARASLGISTDASVVLITGGGEGLATLPEVVDAVLALPGAPVVLAVAGRHERTLQRLKERMDAISSGRLLPFGFTDKMGTLMRACDVIVTKAGPGTMFEAMALGLPMVIMGALPGQEAGNVELVVKDNLGRVAMGGPHDVARAVQDVLAHPEERAGMARRAQQRATPHAALGIARALLARGATPSPDEDRDMKAAG
ncbi:MAG: glycosyltransferase [Myxococcota bacterium]